MPVYAAITREGRTAAVVAVVLWFLSGPLGAQLALGPPLSAANLTRLRIMAQSADASDAFPADLAQVLGLGAAPISGTQISSTWRGGQIFLAFLDTPGGDVVMTVKDATRIAVYLTDATRQLRATALIDTTGTRLVPNAQAASAFRLTLARWNELAVNETAPAP